MSRNDKKPMAAGFKRLFNSRHGKAVFPRALKDETQFEAFLPFVSLQVDDKTILTRGGELIQCIRVDGLNSMTASDRDIALLKETVAELLAQQLVIDVKAQRLGCGMQVRPIDKQGQPIVLVEQVNDLVRNWENLWTRY